MVSVPLLAPSTATRPQSLIDLVGNTPLLPLHPLDTSLPPGVEVYGKAEWANPGGSVKDRPALWMIRDGEERGLLRPGMRIADATSGNTGIAYATLGAALGYGVTLALPANASVERIRTLRALGAELILTDAQQGMDLAIRTIRDVVAGDPAQFFYPDQYNNPANVLAHYETTGPEVWQQTEGRITHFVAGLGTSGTFMGAGQRLREYDPGVRLVAMQPDTAFHAIEGIKHMATTAFVPGIYDAAVQDEQIDVSTEMAHAMARCLARTGLLVGVSAAANVAAAFALTRQLRHGVVVTILCDNASKYLSEHFWEESDAHQCFGGEGI